MDSLSDSELSAIPSPPDIDMIESVYSSGFEPPTSQLSTVENLSFSSQLSSSGPPQLPTTNSVLFTKNLFTRTLLNTDPPTVRYTCTQPQCKFFPKPAKLTGNPNINLWKHYYSSHPRIVAKYKGNEKYPPPQSEVHIGYIVCNLT